tara:strand:- start:132 stop:545 length:414 start_codon:yes stop_codon:yes gene_type:complete
MGLDYLVTFFLSGSIITGVKFLSNYLQKKQYAYHDAHKKGYPLSAPIILATLPIALLAPFFIQQEAQKKHYYIGYLCTLVILTVIVFAICILNVLYPDLSINLLSFIAIIFYFIVCAILSFHLHSKGQHTSTGKVDL